MDRKDDRKLLSQQEIATRAGISQPTVHYILNGDREPSKAMCLKLEQATGVVAGGWMWPEDIYNPYIPFYDAMVDGRSWVDVTLNATKFAKMMEQIWVDYCERWDEQ